MEKAKLRREAQTLRVTSQVSETTSLVALEAMADGYEALIEKLIFTSARLSI